MKFSNLRKQVFEWSKQNFGTEQPPEFPLIGAGEEAGELTTSILKTAQGIDDSDKYAGRVGPEAEMDAIGDIHVYLADFIERYENDVGGEPSVDVITLLQFYSSFGYLCEVIADNADEATVERALEDTLRSLEFLAEHRDVELDESIETTWEEVSGREWDSDVETAEPDGGTIEDASLVQEEDEKGLVQRLLSHVR